LSETNRIAAISLIRQVERESPLEELISALNDRFRRIEEGSQNNVTAVASGSTFAGTSVSKRSYPAANFPGALFVEVDRDVIYQSQDEGWWYLTGTMRGLIAAKPTLGKLDEGFLYYATDYARLFRWTGTAWTRAPGERPTCEIAFFTVAPTTGWLLCDGGSGTRTTDTAGTTAVTTPDLVGQFVKGASSYSGSVNPGTAGGAEVDINHTHSTAVTSAGSGGVNVAPAGATPVSGGGHNHTVDVPALGVTIVPVTFTSPPEPPYMELLPYMRL
jgi:hypothetical protein